jgi:hypothetical protein
MQMKYNEKILKVAGQLIIHIKKQQSVTLVSVNH